MRLLFSIQTAILIFAIPAFGQGTFQNLNFEAAQPIPDPNYGVPYIIVSSNALPAWQAYNGTNQLIDIAYNLTGVTVGLVGSNSLVIDGDFSVLLGGGSISQTASVPPDAKSLLYEVSVSGIAPPLSAFLDGQRLSATVVSTRIYTEWPR
jgi:hypothetical protein